MSAILTYDLGTTGLKTALFDVDDGRLLALVEREIPVHRPEPTWAEQHAQDWWSNVVATTREVVAAARGVTIAAIGLSSQRETIVPVTANGTPLGPAVLWMDRRALAEAQELGERLGAEEVHQITGMMAEPTFSAGKLLWLKRHRPDTWKEARWFLQPKDFLGFKLTGAPFIDPSLASRSLILDTRSRQWWPAMLETLELAPERLPPLVASTVAAGVLTAAAAAELGLPAGIPVSGGGGDRCCEALGAAIGAGRTMTSTSTAKNVAAATTKLGTRLPAGILVTADVLPGRWILEQGITTGGSILKWLRDNVTGLSYAEMDKLAAASRPGANGLLLLPFFMGARATRWHAQARGVFFGLTLGHDRGDLARAIMEGVSFEVRACLELLATEGVETRELVLLGGGASSEVWRQIEADVTGHPVAGVTMAHAASFGAMLLGAAAAGLIDDPLAAARRLNPIVSETAPRPAHAAFYTKLYGLYNRLYAASAGLYEELEALAKAAP